MFVWQHTDARGLAAATSQALARAQIGAWGIDAIAQSQGSRVDDLLALVASSFVLRQELINTASPGLLQSIDLSKPGVAINVLQGQAADVDHVNAQYILIRTWEAVARAEGWNENLSSQLTAQTGKQSTSGNAVAIIAIVVGIVAVAGLLAFLIYNVNTIIDRELARKDQAQELMRAHAECQKMLQAHADAEKQAGHPIPFNIAELRIMARLAALQDAAMSGWKSTLVPSFMPKNPKTPTDVAENVLTLAVVLGFVYFLVRRAI